MKTLTQLQTSVTKEVDGKRIRVPAAVLPVTIFSLDEFDIPVQNDSVDKEGIAVYNSEKIQWVYNAVVAAIRADARNKTEASQIATTIEELLAAGERSGAAMQLAGEFTKAFTKYLSEKSGKNASVQKLYSDMVKITQRAGIPLASEARRNGLATQVVEFAKQASAEDAAKFEGILNTIHDLCVNATVLDDSEL